MVKQEKLYGCGCKGNTVKTNTTVTQTNVPPTTTQTVPTVKTSK
jgi:hypothetical protein